MCVRGVRVSSSRRFASVDLYDLLKLCFASFEGVPSAEAIQQFQERIEHYTRAYETVDEDEYVR